ncbi:Neuronal acetylcholine receptor subunit eat-2 [Caenorhabditis elegans]|uniref:Neuronal acetylcholine receptor subunit eat-2 n=1 Tax=Caenorhabditis elegans TaxID=6239 RepID=ACH8_CAEEL|nr:Neuronal acetylcholine receptor subunit eat-2 [Caenorhabditis elegans]Q9U298.1 RecName: Full=Neuronal acetylcholine receptor subunit eat-2; AltName: Full=Abnormal pharyngeal pumping eat-2; Flags: Precursor [Caenorhabditis elegans]CAB54450.1 Neuronal acetylcholine receptor subunit eat-2 [Caenorhabditis elegans]|eukprot:NP_496959.1 Neuronal acetylcholine receptor subunit eat-2 [Caenorhabditis elegans]
MTLKIAFFTLILLVSIERVYSSDEEYRLLKDLREGYDPVERPVADHRKPVNVKLRLILQQLVDVDERNQVITLVVWNQYTWNDYKLRWSPEEYGNITTLQIPHGTLWKPDILLFNSANEHFDASFPVHMVVSSNGDVLFAPPGIVSFSCSLSMTWFPYDQQVCYLKFGSWTYGKKLDLQIDDSDLPDGHKMDLQYYIPNGEFDLLATPAFRKSTTFLDETYVELYFHMHLKRRTMYYGLNWIVPSILISLSNILGFTMPPECGEKITLQITNFLSVMVFLAMVSEVAPPTSESIPIIAAFFSLSIVILGLSICASLIIVNIFFRHPKTHRMGDWTRYVFLEWLPWFLLMSRPEHTFCRPRREEEKNDEEAGGDGTKLLENQQHQPRPRLLVNSQLVMDSTVPYLEEIIGYLKVFKAKLDDDEEEEEEILNWRFMAMVIDRLSLFLFTGLIFGTTALIFAFCPNLFTDSPIVDIE